MSESPIQGKRLRVTRLDAEGEPIEGSTVEVGETVSFDSLTEPGEWYIPESLDMSGLATFSMDAVFMEPDPELLDLLTGRFWEGMGLNVPPSMIEVRYRLPVRRRAWRVVWEWLTRKPRQYTDHFIGVPYAEVSRNPDGSVTFSPASQDWGCGPFHPPENEAP